MAPWHPVPNINKVYEKPVSAVNCSLSPNLNHAADFIYFLPADLTMRDKSDKVL